MIIRSGLVWATVGDNGIKKFIGKIYKTFNKITLKYFFRNRCNINRFFLEATFVICKKVLMTFEIDFLFMIEKRNFHGIKYF